MPGMLAGNRRRRLATNWRHISSPAINSKLLIAKQLRSHSRRWGLAGIGVAWERIIPAFRRLFRPADCLYLPALAGWSSQPDGKESEEARCWRPQSLGKRTRSGA